MLLCKSSKKCIVCLGKSRIDQKCGLWNGDDVWESIRRSHQGLVGWGRHPGVLRQAAGVSAHRFGQIVSIQAVFVIGIDL